MSKKVDLDKLDNAQLPEDLFTQSLGSSYGIGEYPDMEYGMGVLDGVLNPDLTKAPALPTGLNRESSERLDLTSYLETPQITHLDWLDPSQLQDPSRLPESSNNSLPELEELWGVGTNGITIEANTQDLERMRYEQSLESSKPLSTFNERVFSSVISHAMRRSAMGQNIDTVIEQTLESVGEDYKRYIPAMNMVKEEHGLAGNVFIRKSAFPGFDSGKWNAHIKKYHANAKYLIVAKEDLNKNFIHNGRCGYTGKEVVLDINWEDAYNHFQPKLVAAGYVCCNKGSCSKAALKKAFLTGPKQVSVESNLPVEVNPADRISREQAIAEFKAYQPEAEVYEAITAEQVESKIAELVRVGSLAEEKANLILSSNTSNEFKIKTASFYALQQTREYTHFGSKSSENLSSRRASTDSLKKQEEIQASFESKEEKRVAGLVEKVSKLISKGTRGSALYEEITRIIPSSDMERAEKYLRPMLAKTGALKEKKVQTEVYSGSGINTSSSRLYEPTKVVAMVSPRVSSALRWVRRTMSEGFAGRDLDQLIQQRIATDLLTEIGEGITQTRERHEGGSGFIYVDASAYASETGSKGCEKAAIKHRTNGIPAVASMSRCTSCVHRRCLPNGTIKCAVFNKTLLEDSELPTEVKQKHIREANMTDAEQTAALFSSSMGAEVYDPSEFGLSNSNLDGISFTDLPETEKVSKILFDGWDI